VQLSNAGELVTDGKLTLEMSGDLVNQGLFSSLKAMSISGNNLTQDGGRIASKEAMTLTLNGALSNRGRLTSSQTLDITAASIDNQGTLGAQGKTTLHARGAINNQQDSLLFAGSPLELRGVSLLNHYGDIYSKGDLSFAALDGGKAASLRNLSGSIESEGNIDIKVDYLENAKAKFVHGKPSPTASSASTAPTAAVAATPAPTSLPPPTRARWPATHQPRACWPTAT
jgi:filamentous hemagglutinin